MDKKILLVDDDPDICLAMKVVLDDAGFDLRVAKNGIHGVVLMDVMMPGMNGWDVVREMVDKGYMDGNVVAMFSAKDPPKEEMDALGEYIAGFIEKPFDTEELIEIVNGYTLPFCDTDGNYAKFPSRQDSKSLKSERCRRNLILSEEELDASINLKLDVVVFQ